MLYQKDWDFLSNLIQNDTQKVSEYFFICNHSYDSLKWRVLFHENISIPLLYTNFYTLNQLYNKFFPLLEVKPIKQENPLEENLLLLQAIEKHDKFSTHQKNFLVAELQPILKLIKWRPHLKESILNKVPSYVQKIITLYFKENIKHSFELKASNHVPLNKNYHPTLFCVEYRYFIFLFPEKVDVEQEEKLIFINKQLTNCHWIYFYFKEKLPLALSKVNILKENIFEYPLPQIDVLNHKTQAVYIQSVEEEVHWTATQIVEILKNNVSTGNKKIPFIEVVYSSNAQLFLLMDSLFECNVPINVSLYKNSSESSLLEVILIFIKWFKNGIKTPQNLDITFQDLCTLLEHPMINTQTLFNSTLSLEFFLFELKQSFFFHKASLQEMKDQLKKLTKNKRFTLLFNQLIYTIEHFLVQLQNESVPSQQIIQCIEFFKNIFKDTTEESYSNFSNEYDALQKRFDEYLIHLNSLHLNASFESLLNILELFLINNHYKANIFYNQDDSLQNQMGVCLKQNSIHHSLPTDHLFILSYTSQDTPTNYFYPNYYKAFYQTEALTVDESVIHNLQIAKKNYLLLNKDNFNSIIKKINIPEENIIHHVVDTQYEKEFFTKELYSSYKWKSQESLYTFSVRDFEEFFICPHKYFLRKEWNLKTYPMQTSYLAQENYHVYGTLFHELAENLIQKILEDYPHKKYSEIIHDIDEAYLNNIFNITWISLKDRLTSAFTLKIFNTKLKEQFIKIYKNAFSYFFQEYTQQENFKEVQPLYVELEFHNIVYKNFIFNGKIDRIDIDLQNKKIYLFDYKKKKKFNKSNIEYKDHIQILLYGLLLYKIPLYYPNTNKVINLDEFELILGYIAYDDNQYTFLKAQSFQELETHLSEIIAEVTKTLKLNQLFSKHYYNQWSDKEETPCVHCEYQKVCDKDLISVDIN